MIRLAVLSIVFAVSTAQWKTEICQVGEISAGPDATSPCSGANPTESCEQYCQDNFGSDYVSATCGSTRRGARYAAPADGCVCNTRCAMGAIYGDPHYKSMDGQWYLFQGTCKHLLLKTTEAVAGFPAFEIYLTNYKNQESDFISYPQTIELKIPAWDKSVELSRDAADPTSTRRKLKVDGASRLSSKSYRFHKSIKQKSQDIDLNYEDDYYVISTSFGLKIKLKDNDVFVYVPRHPELVGKLTGFLGNMDRKRENDNVDRSGRRRSLFRSTDELEYALSWCTDAGKTRSVTSRLRMLDGLNKQEEELKKCQDDSSKSPLFSKCDNLLNISFGQCRKENVDHVVANCRMDVCFGKTDKERDAAVCSSVDMVNQMCGATLSCK